MWEEIIDDSTELQTLGELRMRGILVSVYSRSPASI